MQHIQKAYEEKSEYFNLLVPVRLHKMSFPPGTQNIFYLHWHQEFEFFMVTKGVAIFTIEDREYTVHEHEAVFVNSNMLLAARGGEGVECEFIAVVFYDTFLAETKQDAFYNKYIFPVVRHYRIFQEFYSNDVLWQAEIIRLLTAIDDIPLSALNENELIIKSRVLEIWNNCFYHPYAIRNEKKENQQSDRLKPVIEYLEENYMYDINLDVLAKLLHLSVGQFCRLFRQQMHTTPIAYLMRLRILQSCRLLSETDDKIAEIANQTGFNNISYYNKTFQAIIGCTPTVYRSGEHTARGHNIL